MQSSDLKASLKEHLESLSAELKRGKSEALTAYLAMMARFHKYSFGNIMLILAQRPDATRVAGYRTWQSLGRQVRRGEKGIAIFAPMRLKARKAEGAEREEERLAFRAVRVFDVSQTDGEPLPELESVSGDAAELWQHLRSFANAEDISVEVGPLGIADGVSLGGHITVSDKFEEPAALAAVLIHELAHEFLHHRMKDKRPRHGVRELEAEATTYAVCRHFGLETAQACSDCIHATGGDAETLSQVLQRVQETAARIIDGVTAVQSAKDAHATVAA